MLLIQKISPFFMLPLNTAYMLNIAYNIELYLIIGAVTFLVLLYLVKKMEQKLHKVLPNIEYQKSKMPFLLTWFGLIPCYLFTLGLLLLSISSSTHTNLIYTLAGGVFITGLFYSLVSTIRLIISWIRVSKKSNLAKKNKNIWYLCCALGILYSILPVLLFSFIPTCFMLTIA